MVADVDIEQDAGQHWLIHVRPEEACETARNGTSQQGQESLCLSS